MGHKFSKHTNFKNVIVSLGHLSKKQIDDIVLKESATNNQIDVYSTIASDSSEKNDGMLYTQNESNLNQNQNITQVETTGRDFIPAKDAETE